MITFFREAMIFNNLMANQLCDEMMNSIVAADNVFPTTALLSGAAAYALQTSTEGVQINNIIFKVRGDEAYYKLLRFLDDIPTIGLTKYANRTYFKYKAGSIEICVMIASVSEEELEHEFVYNDIRLEDKAYINSEWL